MPSNEEGTRKPRGGDRGAGPMVAWLHEMLRMHESGFLHCDKTLKEDNFNLVPDFKDHTPWPPVVGGMALHSREGVQSVHTGTGGGEPFKAQFQ